MIDNNAAMRVREDSGRVVQRVLRGADPYTVEVAGKTVQLLYLAFMRNKSKGWELQVFLRDANPFGESEAKELLQKFREEIKTTSVVLTVRRDSWFIYDDMYPIVLPYADPGDPPHENEYGRMPHWRCTINEQEVSCRGSDGEIR